jgi:endonuclease III
LEEAVNQVRQKEAVQKQQVIVHVREDTRTFSQTSVDAVTKSKKFSGNRKNFKFQNKRDFHKPQEKGKQKCHRYFQFHPRDKCPARNEKCNKCSKIGQFAKQC